VPDLNATPAPGEVKIVKMDFLKAEIARKKKQMEDSKVMAPDKKYFKRGDLAAKQEEEYWKKHKRLRLVQEEDGYNSPGSPGQSGSDHEKEKAPEEEKITISKKEIIRRLRDRGEPVKLFGESEMDTFQRLKKIEMLQPEINKGFKNDFKAAMDKVDAEYLDEMVHSGNYGESSEQKASDVKVKDDGMSYEEILKLSENLGKGNEKLDCEVILKFLKLVLKIWGEDLNTRSTEEKRSFRGKLASATHTQTVDYVKPLFRKLKKKEVDADILGCLVDMTHHLVDRNYLRANDIYLEMAIGNAPWPIGVTMVGIHARTGREKISARNVAHVLNDEAQRKYIQAVKRIMTQAQKYFPTDPSRSMDYERK